MPLTPSNMLPLGTIAPDFKLQDVVSGKYISLSDIRSDFATVVFFICNHCPYVKHIQHELCKVVIKYQKKGIAFAGINSNDILKYPDDKPERMQDEAKKQGYTFPYLFDSTQETAKLYQAACTPDFYIFDKNLACVYRGRFDESTPGNNKPVTGKDVCAALDAIISGQAINSEQMPSVGCNIKWK